MHASKFKESMISHKGMALIKFVVVLVCLFVLGDAEVRCIEREKEALLSFKDGLIDDYGVLSSWQSGDCCRWYGVYCSNTTGHVVALQLDAAYYDSGVLRGTVGPSLLELHHLYLLDLSSNDFGGSPIPEFVGSMRELQHLYLYQSNFSGIVPPRIGNLTNLLSLDLGYNSLRIVGNLDWLSTSLSKLSFLDLSGIDLSHPYWLNHILNLPSIQTLYLELCNLRDAPRDLSVNSSSKTSLSVLDLADNLLTRLDWLVSNMSTNLVRIDLSENAFSGPIPNALGRLAFIEHLDLSSNMLDGEIPESLRNMSHLRNLVLYNNSLIRGHVFDELFGNVSISGKGILESLQILDLADNQLNGPVPELRRFSGLTELYLGRNNFRGSMPLSLGQLSKLHVLDLSRNSLESSVSESHFIKLHSLNVLDLSFNLGLNLNVAHDWRPPFQLRSMLLGGCNVGPSFPKWIQTQRNVSVIDLSSAGIRDEAPKWLWSRFPLLKMLFLSQNQISGTIPNLSSTVIKDLDLSYNDFSGPIPLFNELANCILLNGNRLSSSISSLCEIPHIELFIIELSNNKLEGEVPNCWEKMPNIFSLSLANNSFWGEIPPSLGSLHDMAALQLRGNNLSGELPPTLRHCQQLELLDVGGNDLTGAIPAGWIGELREMRFLNLGRNQFRGSIPPELCILNHIRILDFSVNNLSGEIPNCFNNFTALGHKNITVDVSMFGYVFIIKYDFNLPNEALVRYYEYSSFQWKGQESEYRRNLLKLRLIDFSSNRLTGNIPKSFSSMKGLISLNLSRNSLTSSIIPDIGEMGMLECLDLSHNQLSGEIPASMAQLQFLAVLDLSTNNLSGKIPSSTQLQSFNASAYAGNGGLCGPPLPSCPPEDSNGADPPTKHDKIFSFVQEVCISVAFGFIVGFWGVVASFVLKKSWRIAYFNSLDAAGDWLHVRTALFLSKLKRRPT